MQTRLMDAKHSSSAPASSDVANLGMFVPLSGAKPPAASSSAPSKCNITNFDYVSASVAGAYSCERCRVTCDVRAYTSGICQNCRWRILRKNEAVECGRWYSTD